MRLERDYKRNTVVLLFFCFARAARAAFGRVEEVQPDLYGTSKAVPLQNRALNLRHQVFDRALLLIAFRTLSKTAVNSFRFSPEKSTWTSSVSA